MTAKIVFRAMCFVVIGLALVVAGVFYVYYNRSVIGFVACFVLVLAGWLITNQALGCIAKATLCPRTKPHPLQFDHESEL